MHLIGYQEQSRTRVGALLTDNSVVPLGDVESFWADPYAAVATVTAATGGPLNIGDLTLVPPVLPSARVLCVGLNYAAHVDEGPFSIPEYPTVFGRWTTSLSVADTPVAVPVDENGLDWEGELLAVVGRPLKLVTAEQVIDGVFAYAAFNDITARRAQKLTTQWTLGKNADNSGPMSALVTTDEVGDPAAGLRIVTTVNGKIAQFGKTSDMLSASVSVDLEKVGSIRTPVV
jgi:2-keto-4-pentenoate hydratase/2-oxohepta-3-ene-1,7-dioic acid hydratase in catechol pathway